MSGRPRTRSSGFLKGCLFVGVGLGVLLVGGVAAFVIFGIPDISDQLPRGSGPMVVSLSYPLNGSQLALYKPRAIQAEVVGVNPIQSLVLWVDDAVVEAKESPGGSTQFSAEWSWIPLTEGPHLLTVRALDEEGHTVTSNPVSVTVVSVPQIVEESIDVPLGSTLESIAETTGVPPEVLVAYNPDVVPGQPVPSGRQIVVPAAVSPTPPEETSPPPVDTTPDLPEPQGPLGTRPPSNVNFWINKNLLGGGELPAEPRLSAHVDGCDVHLSIDDRATNEIGYFIYRHGPGSSQYDRIETLGPGIATGVYEYVDADMAGSPDYYVAAFNAAGEVDSNLVGVSIIDDTCGGGRWLAPQFSNFTISTDAAVDAMYCYMALDNGPWVRVPSAPQSFIAPTGGVFDFTPHIPSLPTQASNSIAVNTDCWGWSGGALVNLRKGRT